MIEMYLEFEGIKGSETRNGVEDGMPVGVQLVGCRERDDRLFRTAAWLERRLSQDGA